MNWKKILRSTMCLVVVLAILLNCVPVKADAVAVTGTLAVGIAACLILMSAGVIFNPKTVEDIQAIGNSFQTYMYQWGTEAEKLEEVETWFGGLQLLDPNDDDDWSPNKANIRLARGLLTGISLWCASIMLGLRKVEDPAAPSKVGFSVTSIQLQINGGRERFMYEDTSSWYDCLYNACGENQAIVYGCNDNYLFGYFWNDAGVFSSGLWHNSLGQPHSSLLGVYGLADLELLESIPATEIPLYFDKETAESQQGYLYSSCLVPDWTTLTNDMIFSCYVKQAENSSWSSGTEEYSYGLRVSLFDADPNYATISFPAEAGSVVWSSLPSYIDSPVIVGDVAKDLESGAIGEEEIPLQDIDFSLLFSAGQSVTQSLQNIVQQFYGGDMTLEKYLELTQAADSGAEAPSIVVDIPLGSELTYYQGATPSAITVLGSSSDGGSITYEWYRYGTDANGKVYPVEVLDTDNSLLPSTADLGTSHYYCRIINMDTSGLTNFVHTSSIKVSVIADPNTGTDVEPDTGTDTEINPDSIGQLDSETFWERLPSAFTQPLESLGTSILEGIKEIFVPSQDYLSSKVDALTAEFGFIGPIVSAARSIVLPFNDFEPEPPIIYLHLEDTRGSYNLGGTVPFIDMTWYAEYKPIGDALLSSLLWVVFVWRLFRQLPGLIAGLPGDFVYDGLQGLHINLPSRSMDHEVQKVKTRMKIAKNAKKGAGK